MEFKVFYGFHGREVSVDDLIGGMEGWREIVESLVGDLVDMGWDRELFQIKEKFGGLRFYVGQCSDEMYDRISEAERKSLETCMKCGKRGFSTTDHGWILTLCEEHKVKLGKNNELLDLDSDSDSAAV